MARKLRYQPENVCYPIIGSGSFVNKVVGVEEEAFPAGHKTPPVEFRVGGVSLRSLRNLSILRKKG